MSLVRLLQRYLSAELVERLSDVLPLHDISTLRTERDRFKELFELSECLVRYSQRVMTGVGELLSNGHYSACYWADKCSALQPDTCSCSFLRMWQQKIRMHLENLDNIEEDEQQDSDEGFDEIDAE